MDHIYARISHDINLSAQLQAAAESHRSKCAQVEGAVARPERGRGPRPAGQAEAGGCAEMWGGQKIDRSPRLIGVVHSDLRRLLDEAFRVHAGFQHDSIGTEIFRNPRPGKVRS